VVAPVPRESWADLLVEGVIAGYDPGGNDNHGLALLTIRDGKATALVTETLRTAEDVIAQLARVDRLIGIGVDTLTCWSTGPSGWRPADRWLRDHYPEVESSVVSPNSLFGSMGLNGMAVLVVTQRSRPSLLITETHPKVLCRHLLGEKYDYVNKRTVMDEELTRGLGIPVDTANDHEWDAAVSTLVLLKRLSGCWSHDLHTEPTEGAERIVTPCGPTHYFWPV